MPLLNKGLNKLTEECGELIQIASKKQAYMETDMHPDSAGSMYIRLEEEIADVEAAIAVVKSNFPLRLDRMEQRKNVKIQTFTQWDNE